MFASTIERPAADHSNTVRRDGSADLIRTVGGVEAPAAGPWEIGSGQTVDLIARGVRDRNLPARVLSGTLVVTDELLGSSLNLRVLEPDTTCCADVAARVTRLLSVDSWQADGTTTIAGVSRPVSLRLRYNGVFRQRGRPPSLWLAIEAIVDLPELAAVVGARRARRLKVAAELNLNPGEGV